MDLAKFINEVITQELDEKKFNPTVLNGPNTPTWKEKLSYVKDVVGLPFVAAGSSRAVFIIDSKRVLKLAISDFGVSQNKQEFAIASTPAVAPIVTKIFDHAEDFSWLVSEIVRPLDSQIEFQKLTDVPWPVFRDFLKAGSMSSNPTFKDAAENVWDDYQELLDNPANKNSLYQVYVKNFKQIIKQPFLRGALQAIKSSPSKLITGDLIQLGHWGKTADQRVVLLDYGFSRDNLALQTK